MACTCVRQRVNVLYIEAAIKVSYIIEWNTVTLCIRVRYIHAYVAVGKFGLLRLLTLG